MTERCPECSRQNFVLSGQNSIALQDTVIADVQHESDGSLPVDEGDALDHFTVLELMGAGGMGAVFRARDESLLRFVALKVIRGRDHAEGQRHRLIHEARAQARVRHPNIVHIYYVGLHNNCPFFAMELVDGEPLSELARKRRLKFNEIVDIAKQTTAALMHSARQGVIHGDVKPANILIEYDNTAKLSDFGLSGTFEGREEGAQQSGPAGTLDYMPPEVAAGQSANELSDMYSLGTMLYELTFGELPARSTSTSVEERLKERQRLQLKFPQSWPQDRPEGWKDFLQKILNPDPTQRFSSYEELATELDDWDAKSLVPAGRVQRACAFLADQVIAGACAGFAGLVALVPQSIYQRDVEANRGPWLWLFLAAGVWIHVRWRKSPGKKLMQLKIVDDFGLKPAPWRLTLKSIGTYMFFWMAAVIGQMDQLLELVRGQGTEEASVYETAFGLLFGVVFLINAVWLMFSKNRKSAIDYFLELKVALDDQK